VEIESPDYIQNSTVSFNITVRAKYTYGENVKGKASIEFGALYEKTYRPIVTAGQRGWTQSLKNGEATFEITLDVIRKGLPYGFPLGGRLKVKARVTSDGVGLVEESTLDNTVFSVKSVVLDISKSRRYFKPGLPYDLEILARRPNGPPVGGVDITLQAFVRTQGRAGWSRIEFTGHNQQTRQTANDGSVTFAFDIPKGSVKLKLQLRAGDNPWTETELFPERSPQDKYLLIRNQQKEFEICKESSCSQEHLAVYSSDVNLQVNLCHVLICRGVIVTSKCHLANSWPNQVSLELLSYTSPCCKLLVFYQLNGGFVADYTVVYSKRTFPNQISIKPPTLKNQHFYYPGGTIDLEISGIPGSSVYLTAVDEGVLLLGDNRLTALEVFNRLRGCSLGCDVTGGRDADGIFKNAGLVYATLSNDIDYNPICFPPPKVEPTLSNLEECCERGRLNCDNCEEGLQSLIDEGIHSEECINAFKDCCGIASQQFSCNFENRARTQSGRTFSNSLNDLQTIYRSYFPESWLLDKRDVVVISDRGMTPKRINLPDTITTWRIYALGTSRTGLFGMAEPVRLRVFTPIFLEVSTPYSVLRNEQFVVKATVFNYNEKTKFENVAVQMKSISHDVCTSAGTAKKTEEQVVPEIAPKSSHTFVFSVVPLSVGDINIEVLMISFFKKESVTKVVRVKPEGFENELSWSSALDPSAHSGEQKFSCDLRTPREAVKDSVHQYLYVTGNILGSVVALKRFDELLQQPYGCGEQNMINFAPNVIVLIYLNHTGQLTQTLLETGAGNIENGYTRQLLYRRTQPPGSFSAFGDSDSHGSTWLTAFVMKSFCQVKHLHLPMVIDEMVIRTGLEWLSTQQLSTGAFEERGRVLDVSLQGAVQANQCSLTAFVLIAYLECSYWSRNIFANTAPAVSRALIYLINCGTQQDPCSNTFQLAISGYALCLAKERGHSVRALGQLWQCAQVNLHSSTADWSATSPTGAVAVETSAYALLGFVCNGDLKTASLISNWLNAQRGLGGGFVSTQDTVIAIQALAAYAERRFGKNSDLTVTVNYDGFSQKTEISGADANLRRSIQVNNSVVSVAVTGSGTGLLQCGVKYNSLQDTSGRGFAVEVSVEESAKTLTLTISIEYSGQDESGMAVVSIHVLSGFSADEDSLKRVIKTVKNMKRYENRGQMVNFYFEKIPAQPVKFSIVLIQDDEVGYIQQAPIRVYDYYNPDVHATKFYAPGSESPLLALLCRGGSCQCGAGKCPSCDKLVGMRSVDKDSTSCPNMVSTDGGRRSITWKILEKEHCTHDFSYLFTVSKVGQDNCRNGWKKIQGHIKKIFKPGIRDFVVGDKIRLFKRVNCRCPSFIKGQSYLYIGNDGPRFLVDYHAVVLKWEKRHKFNTYLSFLKDRGACEDY
jgi:hypothetical protein